nr:Chain B, YWAAAA [synthetic construct]
YWAAAA